ncbi:MAG TPA: DUF418 domain-containing protein [Fimbriimonadaceae bacterium]|nr:DUF418 domain-containing protein [Fimbriimonadaceae bacterium]
MIEPTLANRHRTLDVLRGFAIMGILIANIAAFGGPVLTELLWELEGRPSYGPADALTTAFVTGKFRSTLAILFGVGLWLQFVKRVQVEGNWPGGYFKRMGILAGIGLVHALLIWWGDILFFYAIVGMVAALLVRLPHRAVIAIIVLSAMLSAAAAAGLWALDAVGMGGGDGPSFLPRPETEIEVFARGSYLEQTAMRATFFGISLCLYPFLALSILPLFLIGILYGRSGALYAPSRFPRIRNAALGVGLGLGLPLNLLALMYWREGPPSGFGNFIELFAGPVLAIGLSMLVAMWAERSRSAPSVVLEKVGRLALTNYLLQSVVCSLLFYSFGLGLFGDLDNTEVLAFVPLVWLVNIGFSLWWTRRYRMGPLEWLWRAMTEGTRLPNRLEPDPTPSEAR